MHAHDPRVARPPRPRRGRPCAQRCDEHDVAPARPATRAAPRWSASAIRARPGAAASRVGVRAAGTAARRSGSARAARAPPRCAPRRSRRSVAHLTFAASVFSATFRPCSAVDAAGHEHFGRDARALLDAAAAEVAPVGREVLADGDVERAAVGERLLLLEDALAERVGADDRRAVMVLQGGGDDLRRRGGVRSPRARPPGSTAGSRRRWRSASAWAGCARACVTMVPLGMKMLAISCASSTRPPPLSRRSSTIPRAPSCSACSTASRTSPCAPGLNVASATTPSFTPCTVSVAEATTGSEIVARVIFTVRTCRRCGAGAAFDREQHVGARQALDQRHGRVRGQPSSLRPFTATITSPRLQPGAGRRRGVEHAGDQQPAAFGADGDADAREDAAAS